jgi:hypothetical protein
MEGVQEAAEGAAQTVLDSVAADAAAFPWVTALICVLTVAPAIWSFVEAIKAIGLSKLKRKPPKDAGERTVVGKITKNWPWYPVLVWVISLVGGGAGGLGIGAIDGFEEGELGFWGIVFGAAAGIGNSVIVDKFWSWLWGLVKGFVSRRLGNGGEEG